MPSRPTQLNTTDTLPAELPKHYKMRLLQSEYMVNVSGNEGRFPAGSVLLVEEVDALRWYRRRIAVPAPADAETYGEVVRRNLDAEFFSQAKPVESGDIFDASVTRSASQREPGLMPSPMPVPRTRREKEDALRGAGVVNGGEVE
jgi:hypothetical protein